MPKRLRHDVKPLLLATGLMVAVTLLAAACGETTADSDDQAATTGPGVSLQLSIEDYFFEPDRFTVGAGQQVTFDITNRGQAIHTVRMAGPDGEYETDDDTVSEPQMVKSGETATLNWTAPSEPGAYVFRCDYHPEETGTVTVE